MSPRFYKVKIAYIFKKVYEKFKTCDFLTEKINVARILEY